MESIKTSDSTAALMAMNISQAKHVRQTTENTRRLPPGEQDVRNSSEGLANSHSDTPEEESSDHDSRLQSVTLDNDDLEGYVRNGKEYVAPVNHDCHQPFPLPSRLKAAGKAASAVIRQERE